MEAEQVKEMARSLGADLCGIASVRRFDGTPEGFHPRDIYRRAESVLVFAKRVPKEVLYAESCVPYTRVTALIVNEVDHLALKLSLKLEENGIDNVMIPTDDPYDYWNAKEQHGRGILSLRHAGYFAGIGRLGKGNLLINESFGNMIQIGALLLAVSLAPDPIAEYDACPDKCSLCLESCPVGALDGTTVVQKLCRPLSIYRSDKGFILKKCSICRKVCPQANGLIKK